MHCSARIPTSHERAAAPYHLSMYDKGQTVICNIVQRGSHVQGLSRSMAELHASRWPNATAAGAQCQQLSMINEGSSNNM